MKTPAPQFTLIDPEVEANILAFHVGLDADAGAPRISEAEAAAEAELDILTALQQGVI